MFSAMVVRKKREIGILRIEKIGKMGNFVLRKLGKSILLSSTKIVSLHPIRVIIKATSPQLLCAQGLDQLLGLRRRGSDQ